MNERSVPQIPNGWGYLLATVPFWLVFIAGITLFLFVSRTPNTETIFTILSDPTRLAIALVIATAINGFLTYKDDEAVRSVGAPLPTFAWAWNILFFPFVAGAVYFFVTRVIGVTERRSEEHTSELQSLTNLVCRLLLEKKKQNNDNI